MEQLVLALASVYNKSWITQSVKKQELQKYQPWQNPRSKLIQKEINTNLFSKADSSVDKILSCPRITISNSLTSIPDGVETETFLLDFAQQRRRKNANVPDIHFTLLDAAGVSPTLIRNQNAKAKEIGGWVPFKIWTSDAAKVVNTGRCCLWACAQLTES